MQSEQKKEFLLTGAYYAVLAAALYLFLRYLLWWLLPFLLALAAARAMEPVILLLRRTVHFKRGFSAALLTLFLLFLLGGLLSLLLSALAVFFRDLVHLWSVLLMAWMYATPLFWPVSMIEQVPYHAVRILMYANPMYNYVTFMRDTVIYATMPSVEVIVSCVVWALISLALGYAVFRSHERRFILFI